VLLAVSKATGRACECIPRIASAFGGGVARQGEVCGALTGGVMAVGLLHGRDRAEEEEAKTAAYALAAEFTWRFREVNGALHCRELIELDISTDEGLEAYHARNLGEERCTGIVRNAVRALMEVLPELIAEP
jgi:C_GCAxxG_C_C family probable redox protein